MKKEPGCREALQGSQIVLQVHDKYRPWPVQGLFWHIQPGRPSSRPENSLQSWSLGHRVRIKDKVEMLTDVMWREGGVTATGGNSDSYGSCPGDKTDQ